VSIDATPTRVETSHTSRSNNPHIRQQDHRAPPQESDDLISLILIKKRPHLHILEGLVSCIGTQGSHQVLAQTTDGPLHACTAVVVSLPFLDGDIRQVQCQIVKPACAVLATGEPAEARPAKTSLQVRKILAGMSARRRYVRLTAATQQSDATLAILNIPKAVSTCSKTCQIHKTHVKGIAAMLGSFTGGIDDGARSTPIED
jgi:hypothetical protein